MYKHTFYYVLGNIKYPEIYILLRSATMGAPMSPAYVRGSLASTVASSTTTAASALALGNALETTGRLTAPGDISRNCQSDVVPID